MSENPNPPFLSADHLVRWVEVTTDNWHHYFDQHPQMLSKPCDIRESSTVEDLLVHIFAVELRYAERLNSESETPYEKIPRDSVAAIFQVHRDGINKLRKVLDEPDYEWKREIEFGTRSLGRMIATRENMFLTHSFTASDTTHN